MDGGLTAKAVVARLPGRPIQFAEHCVEQADRMVGGNLIVEARGEQQQLFARGDGSGPFFHEDKPLPRGMFCLIRLLEVEQS